MLKTIKSIGQIILGYVVSMILLNIISACILRQYYADRLFYELVILLLCNNSQINGQDIIFINLVIALKKLIEGIALAVLASFIFTHILNREVKIIFPDKIVLRRRTSEGSEGKLTLGVLIGNPGKRELLDVKCSINCTYLKQVGEIEQRNSETYLNKAADSIQNYLRFSFEINSLPKKFWQHYLERKEEYVNKDFIIVAIMGKTDGLGGYFRSTNRYSIQDIIVDIHDPEIYFKKKVKNIFTSKEQIKIDWKEFPKCIETGEDERRDIVNEIKNYVDGQEV